MTCVREKNKVYIINTFEKHLTERIFKKTENHMYRSYMDYFAAKYEKEEFQRFLFYIFIFFNLMYVAIQGVGGRHLKNVSYPKTVLQ